MSHRNAGGAVPASGAGSSWMMAAMVWAGLSRWKARRPAAISYRISPKENWSERKSAGSPRACSGDMYPIVPRMVPLTVASPSPVP